MLQRARDHPPVYLEHARALTHGLIKRPRHLGEGGEDEVAKRMAREIAVGEPVLKKAPHQRLVLGQAHKHVAHVARRKHSQFTPKAAR